MTIEDGQSRWTLCAVVVKSYLGWEWMGKCRDWGFSAKWTASEINNEKINSSLNIMKSNDTVFPFLVLSLILNSKLDHTFFSFCIYSINTASHINFMASLFSVRSQIILKQYEHYILQPFSNEN